MKSVSCLMKPVAGAVATAILLANGAPPRAASAFVVKSQSSHLNVVQVGLGPSSVHDSTRRLTTSAGVRFSSISSSSFSSGDEPRPRGTPLAMGKSSSAHGGDDSSGPPMLLDPNTRGGALFLGLLLFALPIFMYQIATIAFNVDAIEAGRYIGAGFTGVLSLGWLSTTIFRVATKKMTYGKQLKNYEDAVLAKRLEELDDDETRALVENIERERDEF